ncbi:MAG: hypothetical protein ABI369_11475 [Acetobacteraceae bacterium]
MSGNAMLDAVAAARIAVAEAAPSSRLGALARLAAAQTILGEHTNDPAWLEAAVATYGEALAEAAGDDRARMERNLGAVHCLLGRLTGDPSALAQAVEHGRAAVESYVPGTADWAMSNSNLADALRVRGERTGDAGALNEAVAACRAALSVTPREAFPDDWAMTTTNLANALAALGGAVRLAEAVALYEAALEALDDARLAPAIRYNLDRARRGRG